MTRIEMITNIINKRKPSHFLFLTIILLALIFVFSYSYSINDKLEKKLPPGLNVWLLGKGEYFKDTVEGDFRHLITDFPLLELDPHSNNFAEIEGYHNSKRFLAISIANDTLFVKQAFPNSDTILVATEGDYPIIVRVGALSLQTITIENGGRIDIPVNPYGSNPGGEVVYKPLDWEKYVIKKGDLDITLVDNGHVEMFLEVDHLRINIRKSQQKSNSISLVSYFTGVAKEVKISSPEGSTNINAEALKVDSFFIDSKLNSLIKDKGAIYINVQKHLEAGLLYDLNIAYRGDPTINKKERGYGRVININ